MGRRHPTPEERDERVNLSDDPEEVLRALLETDLRIEPDTDADHSK